MRSRKKLSVWMPNHAPLACLGLLKLIQSHRRFRVAGDTGEVSVVRRILSGLVPDPVVMSLPLQMADGISLLKGFRKMRAAK